MGRFLWAASGLGGHPIRVEDDQALEVKGQVLQEGRELILRHPAVAHARWPLGKAPFIRNPQMAVSAIMVPVLRFHVVALDRREMAAPFGRRPTGWGRARAFIPVDRTLSRTHMPQALGIRQIGRGRGDFIDQA